MFTDPLARIFDDEEHSGEEAREIIIGHSTKGVLSWYISRLVVLGVCRNKISSAAPPRALRLRGELLYENNHRRDAEDAEKAQRKTKSDLPPIIPTDS